MNRIPNDSALSSSYVSSSNTPQGGTELLTQTKIQKVTREAYESYSQDVQGAGERGKETLNAALAEARKESPPTSLPLAEDHRQGYALDANNSGQVFIFRQHAPAEGSDEVPQRGFLVRKASDCLDFFKRCFGRITG